MFTTKNKRAGPGKGPRVRCRLRRGGCQLGLTLEAGEERGSPCRAARGTSTGHRLLPGEAVAGSCGVSGEPPHILSHMVGWQAGPAAALAPPVLGHGHSPGRGCLRAWPPTPMQLQGTSEGPSALARRAQGHRLRTRSLLAPRAPHSTGRSPPCPSGVVLRRDPARAALPGQG